MMDNLGSMLPMLMMMGSKGDSGSDKDGPDMSELIKVMMGMEDQEIVEALFSDGAIGGTAKDRSGDVTVGVLELMVIPPNVKDPLARLRMKTNGPILLNPTQLLQMAKRFATMSEDPELLRFYEEAKASEGPMAEELKAKKTQNAMIGALT